MEKVNFKGLFQSPRGDFGFLKTSTSHRAGWPSVVFQSPRGDFGFLKKVFRTRNVTLHCQSLVSIPSRGFWFFEGITFRNVEIEIDDTFQSPRGDFGFLKVTGG